MFKRKERKEQCKHKKGDVHMQTVVNESMNNLRKRALKRRISFPNQKTTEDVKVENDFFEDAKTKMYEQIAEDERWN